MDDLRNLDDDDVRKLSAMLKKVPRKKLLQILGSSGQSQRPTTSGNTHRAGTHETVVGSYSERQESTDAISRIRQRVANNK